MPLGVFLRRPVKIDASDRKNMEQEKMAVTVDNIDDRIAIARRNIEDLTAQATGVSGSAAEESIAARISDQQDVLDSLLKQQQKSALEKGQA